MAARLPGPTLDKKFFVGIDSESIGMRTQQTFGEGCMDIPRPVSAGGTGLVRRAICSTMAVLLMCCAPAVMFLSGCEKELIPSYSEPQPHWQELRGPLVHSRWAQGGPYAALVPGHELLGCWSVAFAQVLAYHRLQPSGRVSYRTHGGIAIDEVLDRPVQWDRVVPAIGPDTPTESARETAWYCFLTAVVVQKDFGHGEYMDVTRVPQEVEEHYGCEVVRVESGPGRDLAGSVKSELRAARPLIAYYDDILDVGIVRTGHTAIVDGMAEDDGRLFVHMGFGWSGASDGWYDFERLAAERELLYIFLVLPK
jgi:hypothetical protein